MKDVFGSLIFWPLFFSMMFFSLVEMGAGRIAEFLEDCIEHIP